MTNPGERHASPTSWIPSPSLAVNGRAVLGPAALDPPLDRSNLPGRLRGACSGEPGSFLTTILGATPFLEALGGDDLGPLAVLEPRGLPLPDLCVVVALGGAASDNCEGADAVRELDGDDRSEGKDGLSWGAGEGAMAMAALIVTICPKVLLYRSLNDILSSARLAIDLSVYRSDVRWVSGGKIPVHNCLLFNGFFLMREKRMRISSPADRCRGKRPINEFNRLCKFLIPRCKASTKRVRETERRAFGSCFIFYGFFSPFFLGHCRG